MVNVLYICVNKNHDALAIRSVLPYFFGEHDLININIRIMAKKQTNNRSIEETLWQACDRLRGSVEPAEYKHVVLGLLFLKFASDKFEERREDLIAEGQEKYVGMKAFYGMKNVFYLDETSRWSYISQNAKQNDIALKIDTALHNIEKNNPSLRACRQGDSAQQ